MYVVRSSQRTPSAAIPEAVTLHAEDKADCPPQAHTHRETAPWTCRITGMLWKAKRGRDLFRPYELVAIDALRAALSSEAAELLDRQIAAKELVQRLYGDAEVNTYPNRRGKQRHDPAIAFPNESSDVRLATVELHGSGGKGKVVFHAVDGHLFQLKIQSEAGRPRAAPWHHCDAHDAARRSDGSGGGGHDARLPRAAGIPPFAPTSRTPGVDRTARSGSSRATTSTPSTSTTGPTSCSPSSTTRVISSRA